MIASFQRGIRTFVNRLSARLGARLMPALAFAAVACGGDPAADPLIGPVEALGSPAGVGAEVPNLSPHGDGAVLSWLEPTDGEGMWALRVATHAGGEWGPVRTVIERADFFVNWADFPSVTPLSDGRLAAHWLQRGGEGTYDYGVRVAFSDDDGVTWSEPWTPHDDGTPTEHGFVSLAPLDGGGVGVLWLDGRRYVDGPAGPATEEMALRYRTLGPEGEPGPEVVVDPRVCDCCQTSMARTTDGWVAVYRGRSEDEIRDIFAARLGPDGWSHGDPVHRDGWFIDACPVNGPSVAADGERVAVGWFTAAADVPRVLLAFSDDGGERFEEPIRIDGGEPVGRVDVVVLADGTAWVTWVERTGDSAEIRTRSVAPDGTVGEPVTVALTSGGRASGFPRTVLLADGSILTAWTDVSGEQSTIRAARVRTGSR